MGLDKKEIQESKKLFGINKITVEKRRSFFSAFLSNLSDPIIRILIGALLINILFMFRDINWPETVGIAVAIFTAAFVSTVSEYGSEKAFEKLNSSNRSGCVVIRDGKRCEIKDDQLVCGDVIVIGAGDVVPADSVILSGEISVSQAPLTGESREMKKRPKQNPASYISVFPFADYSVNDEGTVFKGCLCTKGECEAAVCRVGDSTFYGSIAGELQKKSKPSPLKERLSELAKSVSYIGYAAAALIMIANLFNIFVIDAKFDPTLIMARFHDIKLIASSLISSVTLGVSVIVMAVPEGLPMMITVVLSSNMKKMLKSGVLVRKMVGIETAGSMNVLFTDKTGTLTTGNMAVSTVMADGKTYSDMESALKKFSALISVSDITEGLIGKGKRTPTEKAISKSIGKGFALSRVTDKLHFTSELKYSACLYKSKDKEMCAVLGAGEKLLSASSSFVSESKGIRAMTPDVRKKYSDFIKSETSGSARVMALAIGEKELYSFVKRGSPASLTIVMLISIRDELRHDIKASVSLTKKAGVHVVMMTGDNKDTAVAIANEAGITDKIHNTVLTGDEVSKMSDRELEKALPHLAVVSRALPSHKLRLVDTASRLGLVSGMTGDGVNDAPSLKAADVGFAMGSGSDVAKEASDIILTNNSFISITKAILYGRTVFESIRKFITFQLTMNLCALGVSLVGPFIGIEAPLTVIQMLWVNMIMDTLGGIAFAGEIPLKKYMQRPPRERKEKILSASMICQILFCGMCTLALCLAYLKVPFFRSSLASDDEVYFLTCFFALFIFCGVFNSFNARAPHGHLFSHISGNKAFIAIITFVAIGQLAIIYLGGKIFRTTPLTLHDLAVTAALSLSVIPADALRKLLFKKV